MLSRADLEACPGLVPIFRTLAAYARLDQAVLVRAETTTARLLFATLAGGGGVHEIHCPLVSAAECAMQDELRRAVGGDRRLAPAVVAFVEVNRLSVDEQARVLAVVRERVIDLKATRMTARPVAHVDPRFATLAWPPGVALELDVPPLADRTEDAVVLLPRMLARLLERPVELDVRAAESLRGHAWPGDVSELIACAMRVVGAWPRERDDAVVQAQDLGLPVGSPARRRALQATPGRTLEEMMAEYEAEVLRVVMTRLAGNKSQAARELGISRSYLIQKCQKYGID